MNNPHLNDGAAGEPRMEPISALVDGQLRVDVFANAVSACVEGSDARAAWHTYHLIGDVLRFGESAGSASDDGFAARVAKRLAEEAPAVRHAAVEAAVTPATENVANYHHPASESGQNVREEAANSPVFRWKLVAGLATMVAVGAVGWSTLGSGLSPAGMPVGAKPGQSLAALDSRADSQALKRSASSEPAGSAALSVQAGSRQMIRDPRLDELLAAHEQAGGVSALSMPAGFLRNATFEGRGR
ncbi:MAG: sigma-E factor negative regulatory protein [Burkholderiales bacterium]